MVAGRESAQWHFNRTPETTGRIELVTWIVNIKVDGLTRRPVDIRKKEGEEREKGTTNANRQTSRQTGSGISPRFYCSLKKPFLVCRGSLLWWINLTFSCLNSGGSYIFSPARAEIISVKDSTLKSLCLFRQVTGIKFSNKAGPSFVDALCLTAGSPGGLPLIFFFKKTERDTPLNDARALINFSY